MCYLVSARSIAAPLLPILQKIGAELGPKLQRQLELATVRWVPDDKAAACMVRLIRATFVQQSHFVLCSNMGKEKRREKKRRVRATVRTSRLLEKRSLRPPSLRLLLL